MHTKIRNIDAIQYGLSQGCQTHGLLGAHCMLEIVTRANRGEVDL